MLASPKASDIQKHQLENEYILPIVELIYDLLGDLQFSEEVLKDRFTALLLCVTDPQRIADTSRDQDFHERDSALEKRIKGVLGNIKSELFEDIYQAMHRLLHEFYLNQSPDDPEDIKKNERLNARTQGVDPISREQLFEQTVQLFGTIKRRLAKIGPELSDAQLRELVVAAIHSAKAKVLAPKKALPSLLTPARTFTPAAQDPRFIRQQQRYEEERQSELLAQQLQDEEDAIYAAQLAQEDSDLDEIPKPPKRVVRK
ncbi:MAG: hypothetical protein AB7I18_13740 [Candidatus Berkiella sp.]